MKNEIDEIKKWKGKIKRKGLKYETKRYIYDFYKYETIRYFGESIHTHESKTVEEEDQSNLLKNVVEFHNESRPKTKKGMDKKGRYLWKCICSSWRSTLNAFKRGIFPIKHLKVKDAKH